MKERPIIFSAQMVRALLDGSKTQTRRIVKEELRQVGNGCWYSFDKNGWNYRVNSRHKTVYAWAKLIQFCPYGVVGDRLWVRETWADVGTMDPSLIVYRADYPDCVPAQYENIPPVNAITWKPSIHMFRRHSRITLEITGVRVEKLGEITESDAQAEGVASVAEFINLWKSINGPGSLDANPWVWVIEFKRMNK